MEAMMKELLLAMVLAQGTDVTTSLIGFSHGATELNPLVLSTKPAPFIAEAAIASAAEVYLLNKLSHKHPKWAKGLSYLAIGSHSAASVNNIIVTQRLKARGF